MSEGFEELDEVTVKCLWENNHSSQPLAQGRGRKREKPGLPSPSPGLTLPQLATVLSRILIAYIKLKSNAIFIMEWLSYSQKGLKVNTESEGHQNSSSLSL